jgi:hypothetical protein
MPSSVRPQFCSRSNASQVPFVVLDEIDVLEALARSGLVDGECGTAVLLCNEAQELQAIVVVRATPPVGALAAISSHIAELATAGCDVALVWMAHLRSRNDTLEFGAQSQAEHRDAAAVLASDGIELGGPVMVSPLGWFLPEVNQ